MKTRLNCGRDRLYAHRAGRHLISGVGAGAQQPLGVDWTPRRSGRLQCLQPCSARQSRDVSCVPWAARLRRRRHSPHGPPTLRRGALVSVFSFFYWNPQALKDGLVPVGGSMGPGAPASYRDLIFSLRKLSYGKRSATVKRKTCNYLIYICLVGITHLVPNTPLS